MEDHPAETIAEHHRHRACRCGPRPQVDERLAGRLLTDRRRREAVEQLEPHRESGPEVPRLGLVAVAGDDDGCAARSDPPIVDPGAFAVDDGHVLLPLEEVALHLADGRIDAGAGVQLAEAVQPPGLRQRLERHGRRMHTLGGPLAEVEPRAATGVDGALRSAQAHERLGQFAQRCVTEVVGVGVDDVGTEEEAQAGPLLDGADGVLDLAVDRAQGAAAPALDVELGEVGAAAAGGSENGLGGRCLEHAGR